MIPPKDSRINGTVQDGQIEVRFYTDGSNNEGGMEVDLFIEQTGTEIY